MSDRVQYLSEEAMQRAMSIPAEQREPQAGEPYYMFLPPGEGITEPQGREATAPDRRESVSTTSDSEFTNPANTADVSGIDNGPEQREMIEVECRDRSLEIQASVEWKELPSSICTCSPFARLSGIIEPFGG